MTTSPHRRALAWLALLALSAAGQEPPEKPRWPDLPPERRRELQEALQGFEQADHAERRARHERVIVGVGAAAAPKLLERVARCSSPAEAAPWTDLLARVTTEAHGPVLVREFERAMRRRGSVEVARFCAQRLLTLGFEPAREEVESHAVREIEDPDLRELVQVTSFRLGTAERLADVERLVLKRWGAWRETLFDVLRARRSEALTARGVALLLTKDRQAQLVGLRLLAGGGLEQAATAVRPFLHTDDRTIQEAAVNAMAFLKEGARPRHDIPVFELIELANHWKGR